MKNRKLSSPILCALVLSLVVELPLVSKAAPSSSPVDGTSAIDTNPAPADVTIVPLSTVVAQTATANTSTPPAAPPGIHTISYTVVAGDSLTSLARKFNSTRKKLATLNNLSVSKLTAGQVLLIPSTKKTKTATTEAKHSYLHAQPVQDFDVPASTFGSCPVPMPSPDDDPNSTTASSADSSADSSIPENAAPVAKLVSPSELAAEEASVRRAEAAKAAKLAQAQQSIAPVPMVKPVPQNTNTFAAPVAKNSSSPRLGIHGLTPNASLPNPRLNLNPFTATSSDQWADRFLRQARLLGDQGIEYDDSWRPPGEGRSWAMDCSNTSRYLYKVTTGIALPRTASDQYYYLHLQGKAWDVPQTATGWADTNYLRNHLKPGDLLFWENTYRPERQPPITHVMVFLGTNTQGQWIMAGSQGSRGGEHNRRNGGPDIYVFKPDQPCGGYTTWLGMVRHQGRFCAFGRPLDADRSKLSVADD